MDEHATSAARGAAVVDGATAAAAMHYPFMPLAHGDFVNYPDYNLPFMRYFQQRISNVGTGQKTASSSPGPPDVRPRMSVRDISSLPPPTNDKSGDDFLDSWRRMRSLVIVEGTRHSLTIDLC